MSLDVLARNLASTLINKYGKTVTITQITRAAYDPLLGTGGNITASPTYSIKTVPPDRATLSRIPATIINAASVVVTFASMDLPVTIDRDNTKVALDGVGYDVLYTSDMYAGEQTALTTIALVVSG